MITRLLSFFCLIITLFFCSCKDENKSSNDTYFGGTIKNRNSDFVTVRDVNNNLVKRFQLDQSGQFIHKFENFEPGIYTFYDSKEAQSFFIEKGDSLIFRLNTIDFDESLVYTGIGSKENNFLMNLFLENEEQEKLFLQLSQLPSKVFKTKVDSIKNRKLKQLKKFNKKYKTSDTFNKVAKGNIIYQNYYSKEFYPFARLDKDEIDVLNSIDKDFYDYRADINYNDKLLQNYFPYKTFLRFHFNNLALNGQFKNSKDNIYSTTNLNYNLDRLDLVDKKINTESIKNNLTYYYMMRYLNQSKNINDFDVVFNKFKSINTNKNNINNASIIVNTYKRLQPGFKLPNVSIIDKDDKTKRLNDLITKPTVIYFWTKNNKYHLIDAHKKVNELKLKYPEIDFIAVNTDNISSNKQAALLKSNQLMYDNEFHFKNPKNAKDLLAIKPINNVFLVNKKAEIINPKANMFSVDFEQQLVEILN